LFKQIPMETSPHLALVWLNRLGIVLNFLAGFMLAPELIGLERIKNAEKFLQVFSIRSQDHLHSQKSWVDQARISSIDVSRLEPLFFFIGLILFFSWGLIILPWISILGDYVTDQNAGFGIADRIHRTIAIATDPAFFIPAALGLLSMVVGEIMLRSDPQTEMESIRSNVVKGWSIISCWFVPFRLLSRLGFVCGVGVVMTLKLIVYFISTALFSAWLGLIQVVLAILRFIQNKLQKEGRLRSFIVSAGIALFIIGNLLQLIATF
jgi:hypothetical protein